MEKSIKPETIKNNIERLQKNRSWGQVDLEKRIGGSRNVSNIMRGISKYPTIEVLQRIANAFNVEVSQLLVEQNDDFKNINYDLLSDSFKKVLSMIAPLESQYNLAPENVLSLVIEVYHYSQKLNLDTVDDKFIEWIISKYYN